MKLRGRLGEAERSELGVMNGEVRNDLKKWKRMMRLGHTSGSLCWYFPRPVFADSRH